MSTVIRVEPEYVYSTIPAEFVCVYQKLLFLLADYGEEMLKDCRANETERNIQIIECHNMFNSAVAAHRLEKYKLASVLIKFIKVRINNIYKGFDNSRSAVFPLDENGEIKAFVTCGERPLFEIDADSGELFEHKFNNGFDEHFRLSKEDMGIDAKIASSGLVVDFMPKYEVHIKPKHHIDLIEYAKYIDSLKNKYPEHDYDISDDSIPTEHEHTIFYNGHSHTYTHAGPGSKIENESFEKEPIDISELIKNIIYHPCGDILVYFNGTELPIDKVDIHKYFDNKEIIDWHDVHLTKEDAGEHSFKLVVNYHEHTKIVETKLTLNTITDGNED